jgi:chromosome partitioning protein
MAKILMFGNQKGGVGKSQCTVMTATALSQAPFNLDVTVIDADPQKSIVSARKLDLRTYDQGAPYEVLDLSVKEMQQQIRHLDETSDIILIDVAGKLDSDLPIDQQEITRSLMYVDYLFIPFVAGNYNLEASMKYLQFVLQVEAIRSETDRPLQAVGFVNMYRARTLANKYLAEDIDQIKKAAGIKMMKTDLHNYTLFNDADTFVSVYDPSAFDTAKINFLQWLNELVSIIKK